MVTRPATRHPFDPIRPSHNYRALWDANFAWGIIALALVLFALAIWAFMASDWYRPAIQAPIDVPAVENPSPPNERAELPPNFTP
jgi:hypothetical protein